MVPAPTFTRLPTSESPRYERWFALEPAPSRLAFTSTKFPTCTSSARRAPGRRRANGPTRQRSPSSASSRCEKASTSVPAPMLTFFSTQFGPTRTWLPRVTRQPRSGRTELRAEKRQHRRRHRGARLLASRRRRARRALPRRAVRASAARRPPGRGRACRKLRRGEGEPARRRLQGEPPLVPRRLRGRQPRERGGGNHHRSEERRVGKECRSRWSPYH